MGKLIISRRKEWINRARKFSVFINGEKAEYINNGEIKEIVLEPGKYNIFFKVDWCTSPEIEMDIQEEKSKTIEVSSFKGSKFVFPVFYTVFGLYFLLEVFLKIEVKEIIYLGLPVILLLLYYITIGRKKYIQVNLL